MAPRVYALAPDGGWGWMVVVAGFVQSALVFGIIRSFGVFFVEFVVYFRESSGTVSWVMSLGVTGLHLASPLSSALSTRYGARPVVMIGGFLSGLGLLLASFALSITHLYLSVGLVTGLGWALVFTPSMATVSRYFERRRMLATGLAVSGAGVSSLVFSPLFQYLVDLYGWRGALMLVAGLSLNLVVSGILLRPLVLEGDQAPSNKATRSSWLQTLASLFSLELLHHGPFMRFVLVFVLIDTGYFVPYAHMVAHAREVGCDEYQAASLMSIAAIADLCGRVLASWLANYGLFRHLFHHLTLWTVLTGASVALVPLAHSYALLLPLGIGYGFFAGALVPFQFSCLVEIVGTAHVLGALGLMHMLESVGALVGTPLSGWLRDVTGTYTASFITAGAFLFAGGLILVTLPDYSSCSRLSKVNGESPRRPKDQEMVEFRGSSLSQDKEPGPPGAEPTGGEKGEKELLSPV